MTPYDEATCSEDTGEIASQQRPSRDEAENADEAADKVGLVMTQRAKVW